MRTRQFIISLPWPEFSLRAIWPVAWRVGVLLVLLGAGGVLCVLLPGYEYRIGIFFGAWFNSMSAAFGWFK